MVLFVSIFLITWIAIRFQSVSQVLHRVLVMRKKVLMLWKSMLNAVFVEWKRNRAKSILALRNLAKDTVCHTVFYNTYDKLLLRYIDLGRWGFPDLSELRFRWTDAVYANSTNFLFSSEGKCVCTQGVPSVWTPDISNFHI